MSRTGRRWRRARWAPVLIGVGMAGIGWRGASPPPAPVLASPADSNPVVVLETSRGAIAIELLPHRAPKTVERILTLVADGFYDEILVHRIVRDRVVQLGLMGMDGQFRGQEMEPIENEADNRLLNQRGTVAMARLDDPHSATTEFFINVRDNRNLNFRSYAKREWGFAVFGEVVEGMAVVDDMARSATKRLGPFRDFPSEPIGVYAAYVREWRPR